MTPGASPELASLRCQRCGGGFALAEPARAVVCPYCRNTERVPEALLAQLAAYDARARAALADATASVSLASRMQLVESSGRAALWFYVVVLALTAGSMLAAVVFFWDREPGARAPYAPLLGLQLLGYAVVVAAAVRWMGSTAKQAPSHARAGHFSAACPHCGAVEELSVGQVHHSCSYCRANLLPSGAVMAAGLSVAGAQLRSAELEKLRASRRMFAGIGARKRSIQLLSQAWLIVLPLGASVVFAHHAARGTVDPAAAPFWSSLAAAAALFLLVRGSLRRRRAQCWRKALESLALRDPAPAFLDDFYDIVSWLDAYFPEPYGKGYGVRNTGSADLQALSQTVRGFPVLVVVHSPSARRERFVDCLVAAVPRAVRVSFDHSALEGEVSTQVVEGALRTALGRAVAARALPAPRL